MAACVIGLHGLALCAALAAALPPMLIAALVLLVLASAYASVYQVCWWRCVQWRADDSWWVGPTPDALRRATLLPASVVTPWGCVLQLRCERDGQRVSVLLTGNAAGHPLRRVRVRMRAGGVVPTASAESQTVPAQTG